MPKTLLVPLDGSLDAERALPVAEALADRFDADIVIAVDRDPAPLVLVRDVGATHVVTSSSDTAAQLLELTRGAGPILCSTSSGLTTPLRSVPRSRGSSATSHSRTLAARSGGDCPDVTERSNDKT